jgi:hypothetical protein
MHARLEPFADQADDAPSLSYAFGLRGGEVVRLKALAPLGFKDCWAGLKTTAPVSRTVKPETGAP